MTARECPAVHVQPPRTYYYGRGPQGGEDFVGFGPTERAAAESIYTTRPRRGGENAEP